MAAAHLLQRAIRGESYDLLRRVRRAGQRPAADRAARPARAGRRRRPRARSTRSSRRPTSSSASRPAPCRTASLSKEAHETLAQAMNLLGGRRTAARAARTRTATAPGARAATTRTRRSSRSPRAASASRPSTSPTPTSCRSRWPRAPSPARAASCPGHKVSDEIARLRHTQPGVGLISPPPAPRHLLHRGPGPAHLRPQAGQRGPGVGEAGGRGRRGHDRRRRASRRWPTSCTSQRPQRRHRRQPAVVDQARRHAVGARPGRHPAGAGRQRPARPGAGAGRRRVHDRPPGASWPPCWRRRVLASAPRR